MKRIETHLHTAPNSTCAIEYPRDVARLMKNAGYDTVIVTNHYRKDIYEKWLNEGLNPVDKYLESYHELVKYGERLGLEVWLGAEVNLVGYNKADIQGPVHEVLLYGITEDFIHNNAEMFDYTLPQLYDICHKEGILLIQAHPLRRSSRLADLNFVDGLEVFNGNPRHDSHNSDTKAIAIEHNMLMTSGGDFHQRGDEGRGGMYIPSIVTDIAGFVQCIKDGSAKLIEE